MKKMVITGVNGFIGRHAKEYFEKEYEITGLDLAANTDEMLSPREELVSAWQILESVKRNNRLSMRTQWEQSQEF